MKNKNAIEMQKLSIKKQKSDPKYYEKRKLISLKGIEARKKQAIKRAIAYLLKNGYKVSNNIISK